MPSLSCFPPLLSCFSAGQPVGGGPQRSQQQRNNKQLPGPEPLFPEEWEENEQHANGGEAFSPFSAPQQQGSAREPHEQSRSLSSSSLTASSEPGVGEPGGGAGAHVAAGRASGSTFLSPFTCLAAPATACFSGEQPAAPRAHHGGRAAAVNCLPAMRTMVRPGRHGPKDVHRLPGPLSPLPEDGPLEDDQPTIVNGWVPTLEELMAAEDVTYRTGYSRTSPAPSTLADEFCSFTTSHSAMNSPSPSLCRRSPTTAAAAAAATAAGAPPSPHALHRSSNSNSVHSSSGIGVVKQNSCGSEDSGLSFCGPPGSSRFHLPLPPSTPSGSLQGVSSVGEYREGFSGPNAHEQDSSNPMLQHVPSVGTLRTIPSKGNMAGVLPSRATSLTTAREGSRVSMDGGSEVNTDGQVGRSSNHAQAAAAPEQVQLDNDDETASQQADRLYTHEVLENFRTQPPHPEPRSGVIFPGMCCDINLAGVGVRAKRLFGAEIIVYALGAYVDGEGARRELTEAHARNPSRDTLATEFIISETMSKAIRIVMTLSVSQSQFMGALEERLVPPLKAAKAMHLLDKLRDLLSGVTFGKGTEIVLSTMEGGILTILVNGETKGVVQSLLLCRSLYDVWLGKESVAPDLRESFLDTMEKLISSPRS